MNTQKTACSVCAASIRPRGRPVSFSNCITGFRLKIKNFPIGFTLIELLIVISIIALLLGILVPSLNLARRCARASVCGANLHRIGVALNLYAQDSRGFYPRALPLAPGANPSKATDWLILWPSEICPMFWQAGYPSLLAPYLSDVRISDLYDYLNLPQQMGASYIGLFRCPDNKIKREDEKARKCNFPLDYGLHNRASQNRQTDLSHRKFFLAADQTWGLAFIPKTNGPNPESELQGWWNPFVHVKNTISVLCPSFSVERLSQEEFIRRFDTVNPPCDDPL